MKTTAPTLPTNTTFELVNDKAELVSYLDILKYYSGDYIDVSRGWEEDDGFYRALDGVLNLVPRLMASYEELLETSYALTDGWEAYMNNQTPSGLHVP